MGNKCCSKRQNDDPIGYKNTEPGGPSQIKNPNQIDARYTQDPMRAGAIIRQPGTDIIRGPGGQRRKWRI